MTSAGKPCSLSISETAAKIKAGVLTSVELVSSCLERIDALEENIQAWALVDRERALEAAQSLDRELQQGKRRGPLHGIPVGIKDIFYTAGLRTEAGSPYHGVCQLRPRPNPQPVEHQAHAGWFQ